MGIIKKGKFEHQMPTQNPFVICMHHLDYFPEGDENSNPKEIKKKTKASIKRATGECIMEKTSQDFLHILTEVLKQ